MNEWIQNDTSIRRADDMVMYADHMATPCLQSSLQGNVVVSVNTSVNNKELGHKSK